MRLLTAIVLVSAGLGPALAGYRLEPGGLPFTATDFICRMAEVDPANRLAAADCKAARAKAFADMQTKAAAELRAKIQSSVGAPLYTGPTLEQRMEAVERELRDMKEAAD